LRVWRTIGMKYRTRLYFSFVGIGVVSVVLALGIVYSVTQKKLFDQMRTKVASIAASAAALVDPDLMENIHTSQDEYSPDYNLFQQQLRKVAGSNQREDIYIKYVYTIQPSPLNPKQLIFVVDAAEAPEGPGEVYSYSDAGEILAHLDQPYGEKEFSTDPWGIWLSGFAPIYDSQGKYIATLGLDANVQSIVSASHRLLIYGAISLCAALLFAIVFAYLLSRVATSSLASLNRTVKEIGQGNLTSASHLRTHDEFENLGDSINEMTKGLRERERLKMNFARYVSQYVLEKILQSESLSKLEGERKKITVLVSDIRQFTLLAEKLHPEEVISLLNQYFERMLDVIFRNHGTLDKFMGDGILVEFGAPLDDPEQEKNALTCALQMQEELKNLCDAWEKEGKPRIEIGIGIHTGLAIIGNIGSEKRMEFTAIGNTINFAHRLEQATKILKKTILVSEDTALAVKDQFTLENLGPVTLPDGEGKTNVYALLPYPEQNEEDK
jgi:adenylate cyclase